MCVAPIDTLSSMYMYFVFSCLALLCKCCYSVSGGDDSKIKVHDDVYVPVRHQTFSDQMW